jgi:hypothetical protein
MVRLLLDLEDDLLTVEQRKINELIIRPVVIIGHPKTIIELEKEIKSTLIVRSKCVFGDGVSISQYKNIPIFRSTDVSEGHLIVL